MGFLWLFVKIPGKGTPRTPGQVACRQWRLSAPAAILARPFQAVCRRPIRAVLMKLRSLVVAVAAFAMAGGALAQDVSSEKGKLSYYFGYDYGNNLAELTARGEQLDINSVVEGSAGRVLAKPALTAEQLKPALEAFQKREQARAQQAKAGTRDKVAAENKTKSDQFIASFKAQPGVKTLPGGVAYKVQETAPAPSRPRPARSSCRWPAPIRSASVPARRARRSR